MLEVNTAGKKTRKPQMPKIPVSNETNIQLKIISAQGMTDESTALEYAVNLLYQLLPSDKNARVNISDIVQNVKNIVEEKKVQNTETE